MSDSSAASTPSQPSKLQPKSTSEAPAAGLVGHTIAQETPETFDAFPMAAALKEAVAQMGYTTPTPVQAHVIGPATSGADLLVQSKTGSGKTCAFGLPILERLGTQQAAAHRPRAMVLAPTRELANQVAKELSSLAQQRQTRILAVYGGMPMGKQVEAIGQGIDVVVATPGRLLDLVRRGHITLEALEIIVLDEADEMLSMGFWDDVMALVKMAPSSRQTLLFSATLPYEVVRSAAHLQKNPVRVDLSGDDLSVDGIDNKFLHVLPQLPKPRQLLYVLEGARAESAIIFCNTRNETEMVAKYLTQLGLVAEPISGNLKQKERDRTMSRIKNGELRYMVATDIAARGIDINDLSHVFNYSLPEFCEVYLHRVGRTGRAGKVGVAISLVDGKGLGTLSVLQRDFNVKFTEMTLPPEQEVLAVRSGRIMKELLEKAQMAELGQHLPVAQNMLKEADAATVVAFLLKQYFAREANALRSDEAPHVAAVQDSEPSDDAFGESAGAGGRKKRRRRGRRRGGDSEAASFEEGAAAPAQAPRAATAPYEIIDAVVLLGGAPAPEPAPQAEAEQPRRRQAGGGWQPAGDSQEGRRERPERGGPRRRERGGDTPHAKRQNPRSLRSDRSATPSFSGDDDSRGNVAPPRRSAAPAPPPPPAPEGFAHIRVNIGFDDGFKGRGAVAKRIAALAGLNEGALSEVESRRDFAILKATPEIADMVLDRVDGAQLGKKVIEVQLS